MIVRAAPVEDYGWLISRIRVAPTVDFKAIEAVSEDGRILAMTGYDRWTPNAVEMHIAVDDPAVFMSKGFIKAGFGYVFDQGPREVILISIRSDNKRSLKLVNGLGFREVWRFVDGWSSGVDMVVFEMRKRDCMFLEA